MNDERALLYSPRTKCTSIKLIQKTRHQFSIFVQIKKSNQKIEDQSPQRQSATPFESALDRADNLVGCLEGGPEDLASNPAHLDGFGKT